MALKCRQASLLAIILKKDKEFKREDQQVGKKLALDTTIHN